MLSLKWNHDKSLHTKAFKDVKLVIHCHATTTINRVLVLYNIDFPVFSLSIQPLLVQYVGI